MFQFNDDTKTINVLQRELEAFLSTPRLFNEVKDYYIKNNLQKYATKDWQHHNKYQYVYIFRKKGLNEIYVGETKNIFKRLGDYITDNNVNKGLRKDLTIYEFEYYLIRVDNSELEEATYIRNYQNNNWFLYNIQRPDPTKYINKKTTIGVEKLAKNYKKTDDSYKGFGDIFGE